MSSEQVSGAAGWRAPTTLRTDSTTVKSRYRVAIVESDDLIRQLVERWLVDEGHSVKAVSIKTLQRHNGVDLIIANVPSPRAAAPLIQSLRAAHAAPLLLISARLRRSPGASTQLASQLGVAAVLAKPFARHELIAAVDRAMA
jgi:DNA-binding response OmpR family regulator